METPSTKPLSSLSLDKIAQLIKADWKNVYFGAKPYLEAMFSLESTNDSFGFDAGKEIVRYFLANSQTWKGETARQIKAELKKRLK